MLLAIIIASIAESLVSFFAGVAVILGEMKVRRFSHWVISFAVGVLLGVVFLDLLPETIERISPRSAFQIVLGGFLAFFIFEKFVGWFHHHADDERSRLEVAGYIVIFGDAIHNFVDGIIIALAFIADFHLGVATSIAVVLHEIPQEISDFTIMLRGGFSKKRALCFNVLISLTTIIGAMVGYIFARGIGAVGFLLAIVAGNFLYLAAADLIPELHHNHRRTSAILQVFLVLVGVGLIYGLGMILPEYK